MAEVYGVTLKIAADTSDIDKIPQKVEETRREIAQPVEQTVKVEEQRETAAPVEHPAETVAVTERRETAAPVEHPAEAVKVEEKREAAAPVEHPAETVAVTERRETSAPVKHPAETVKVEEQREAAAPVEHPAETVKVNVEQPKPVKIEAKADKVRVEVDDAEAKKRIEALTENDGVKRIRVVTEGGELATRTGGKEIFELEVDAEKAKKTIADLKADARLKVTADTQDAMSGFNAMRAASAALHGNFMALGMEIAKIGNGIGAMKSIGVGGFFAIGAAITGVVSLAKSLQGLFQTLFNVGTVGRDISSIGASLVDIKNQAEQFADAMNDARKASELVNQSLEKEIAALGRVAKAQNDINRQRELSGAKSDEERDRINTKYDRQAIDIGANTAQQTEELKRKGIVDEIARLEQEIEQSKKTQASYEDQAAKARARARENTTLTPERQKSKLGTVLAGTLSWSDSIASVTPGITKDADKARAASEAATNAQNAADDEAERRAQLEEELEKRRHDLKNADLEAEARKAEEAAAKAKNAQDASTKASQESERKAKENSEKDKKQKREQADFSDERSRRKSDDAFEDRMRQSQRVASDPNATQGVREAAEREQVQMLGEREEEANQALAAAEAELAEELKKDAKDSDEERMARARRNIQNAEQTSVDARRRREDLESEIENRRVTEAQDYFGNLARQIDASRPQNRLTAMGLGSGDQASSTAREQASDVRALVSIARELLSATRDNKPSNAYATFAP